VPNGDQRDVLEHHVEAMPGGIKNAAEDAAALIRNENSDA
jgi:hypothetical protein